MEDRKPITHLSNKSSSNKQTGITKISDSLNFENDKIVDNEVINKLFLIMTGIFTFAWTSANGARDTHGLWGHALKGFKVSEIKTGLLAMDKVGGFPPKPYEFAELCRPIDKSVYDLKSVIQKNTLAEIEKMTDHYLSKIRADVRQAIISALNRDRVQTDNCIGAVRSILQSEFSRYADRGKD